GSHNLMVLSMLAEARALPSGLHDTDTTPCLCPFRVAPSFGRPRAAVATASELTVHSLIPPPVAAATDFPSGLRATDHRVCLCPLRVARSLPVSTSHKVIVRSSLPAARVLPSGLHDTEDTVCVCPLRVSFPLPVAASQSLIV